MTEDFNRIAQESSLLTLAVARGEVTVDAALCSLKTVIRECCDLNGLTNLRQITWRAMKVTSILYPRYASLLTSDYPEESDSEEEVFPTLSTQLIACLILTGIRHFDTDPARRIGAAMLGESCPPPIPPSGTPFQDDIESWSRLPRT